MTCLRPILLFTLIGLAACSGGVTTPGASDARTLVGDGGGNGPGVQ